MNEGIKKDILLKEAVTGFLKDMEDNKQFTKHTIDRLGTEAKTFLRYSYFNFRKRSLFLSETIYPRFVINYLNKFKYQKNFSNKITFFQCFLGYLMSKDYIDHFDVIQAFKERKIVSQESPKIFTNEQLLELIQLSKEGPNTLRNHCLILILVTTGIRIDELRHLRLCDIDFENKSLQVNGKGKEIRKIAVPSLTIKAIKDYVWICFQLTEDQLEEEKNSNRYLFPSKDEKTTISARMINYIIRKLILKAQTIPFYYWIGYT